MPFNPSRDALIFEGAWDAHACVALLRSEHWNRPLPGAESIFRHREPGSGIFFADRWPTALSRFAATATTLQPGSRVALVVDHDPPDGGGQQTSAAVASRLGELLPPNTALPTLPRAGGLDGIVTTNGVTVGIWFMPDNAEFGAIERFLLDPAQPNPLAKWAIEATTKARGLGGTAKPQHEAKSILRTYLAWHDKPDEDYGEAVKKGRFNLGHALAQQFVAWFDRMFP
jgi:hypothetical protein